MSSAGILIGLLSTAGAVLFYFGLLLAVSYADGWQAMAAHFAVQPRAACCVRGRPPVRIGTRRRRPQTPPSLHPPSSSTVSAVAATVHAP